MCVLSLNRFFARLFVKKAGFFTFTVLYGASGKEKISMKRIAYLPLFRGLSACVNYAQYHDFLVCHPVGNKVRVFFDQHLSRPEDPAGPPLAGLLR